MEEKILKELENINVQIKGFDSKIDAKLKAQKEEICSEIREEFKEELDIKLERLKNYIISDVSNALKENMNTLNDTKNEQQKQIVEELREHKVRTIKGVRAFERALTV